MSKKWVVSAKRADFNEIAARFNISPYLARIIRNRDIIEYEDIDRFLNGNLSQMYDPALLQDIDIAADILRDAIEASVNIRVVGDYDIDGVCASYILKTGLEYMGASVDVRIPDRILDGYGINENIIREAAEDNIELIITCDNGIAAFNEIQLANDLGMTVIVTDHHEIPFDESESGKIYKLPQADAVIDPKREDCTYPFEGICGAMVAYKLITYMLADYEGTDKKDLIDELLSFAAFATIGDVMELRDENRIAVKYGLSILRSTNNIGMKALMEVTGIVPEKLTAYSIGFVLGPCVNASGRLDTAKRALELFCCVDYVEALNIANELRDLNESRKNMTESFAREAISMVEEEFGDDKVLVVFLPSCHESIAGIVAGRIRERFYKPTIVLTLDSNGGVKGSGRSIEAYDMFTELSAIKELFTKFGGHKMAAGLSMSRDNVEVMRRRLNANSTLTDDDMIEKVLIDIPMPIGYITEQFVRELDRLAPFGVANSKPYFAQKDVPVKSVSLLGKNNNLIRIILAGVSQDGRAVNVNGVIFNADEEQYNRISQMSTISILYQAQLNEFRGETSVQLDIKDFF